MDNICYFEFVIICFNCHYFEFVLVYVFRKCEIYSMEWAGLVDLSKFTVAAAAYGGPIGKIHPSLVIIIIMDISMAHDP